MRIMKFGGTSLGTAERIKHAVYLTQRQGGGRVMVCSAMSGITNKLECTATASGLEEARESVQTIVAHFVAASQGLGVNFGAPLFQDLVGGLYACAEKNLTEPCRNELLTFGERLTVAMIGEYLRNENIEFQHLNALDYMVLTPEREPNAEAIAANLNRLADKCGGVYLTEGFICRNCDGGIDNLGRGGSDYTASLVGAALDADAIEIWTDVSGMQNNDPRYINNTRTIKELSFDEAAELAYFGAKVLHPLTIAPARERHIPVYIKNTFMPDEGDTRISEHGSGKGIKAIAAKDGITVIKIKSAKMLMAHGFLAKVFAVFDKYKTSIDMITTSEVAVSVTIDNTSKLPWIIEELAQFGYVSFEGEQTIVSVVGDEITNDSEALIRAVRAFSGLKIRMLSHGGSLYNFSFLVPTKQKELALNALHEALFIAAQAAV